MRYVGAALSVMVTLTWVGGAQAQTQTPTQSQGDPIPGIEIVTDAQQDSDNKSCNNVDDDCSGPEPDPTARSGYVKVEGVRGEATATGSLPTPSGQSATSPRHVDGLDGTYKGKAAAAPATEVGGAPPQPRERCLSEGRPVPCPDLEMSARREWPFRGRTLEKLPPAEAPPLEPLPEIDE